MVCWPLLVRHSTGQFPSMWCNQSSCGCMYASTRPCVRCCSSVLHGTPARCLCGCACVMRSCTGTRRASTMWSTAVNSAWNRTCSFTRGTRRGFGRSNTNSWGKFKSRVAAGSPNAKSLCSLCPALTPRKKVVAGEGGSRVRGRRNLAGGARVARRRNVLSDTCSTECIRRHIPFVAAPMVSVCCLAACASCALLNCWINVMLLTRTIPLVAYYGQSGGRRMCPSTARRHG